MTTATATMPDVLAAPPDDWFTLPGGHDAAYDVAIEADGRVHGYPAATWDTCHLSYQNECVTPPRSASGYAYFKVGSVRTASGALVATGPLTLRGGHADPTLSASKAMAFYDDTNSAFADVAIGEDEHGIWIAGAVRPDTTPAALRAALGSGFSGDWRWIGDGYELIALSAVNTPGFRRRITEQNGMVASMIVDMPRQHPVTDPDPDIDEIADRADIADDNDDSETVADADAVLASAVNRIATSIGRSTEQRIAMLQARVHPEVPR
jgi:hypothetical protein